MRKTLLLLLLVGCARTRPSYGGIYLGTICSGGSPIGAPAIRRAAAPDTALSRTAQAGLVVIVDSSTTQRRLAGALVQVRGTTIGAQADDTGRLFSRLQEGTIRLVVRRMGYHNWDGTLRVRAGYRDTIELGLGAAPMCYFAD